MNPKGERSPMSQSRDNDAERFREREKKKKEYSKQLPTDDEPPLPPPVEPIQTQQAPGRNDPCPCGSGKKYKQCCAKK